MIETKVILRADGGSKIGMGHFTRLLALAEMLNNDFYCIFVTRNPSTYQIEEIKKVSQELIKLSENASHFEEFLNYLFGDEIVVLDNYYFSTEYQRQIKQRGCKLVCIDDNHDKHYVADVIINHSGGVNTNQFSLEKYSRLFLGYDYAILREAFYKPLDNCTKKNDLLIGIGGADPLDISFNLWNNLKKHFSQLSITVVVGSAYEGKLNYESLNDLVIYRAISGQEITNLMSESRFGLFPASTLAMEAIAMRLPFAVGYFTENQIDIYEDLIKKKLAFALGDFRELQEGVIINVIAETLDRKKVLDEIIENQRLAFDKKSPLRIKRIFSELAQKSNVSY